MQISLYVIIGALCLSTCDRARPPFERFETKISVTFVPTSQFDNAFDIERYPRAQVSADVTMDVRHAERVVYLTWENCLLSLLSKDGRRGNPSAWLLDYSPAARDQLWSEILRVARAAYPDYELISR